MDFKPTYKNGSSIKPSVATPVLIIFLLAFSAGIEAASRHPGQSTSLESQSKEPEIRTTVREVQVPVVVTDKKGHYVSDLKASDFTILEEGVLQKIISFRASADSAQASLSESNTGKPGTANQGDIATSPGNPLNRTYWICVDTLHSSFSNFKRVNDALDKFFQQETPSQSNYSLVAVGRDSRVVQDTTPDPGLILKAIQDGRLGKAIIGSEASNTASDAKQFTEAVRQYCDVCPGACTNWPAKGETTWCDARKHQVQALLVQFEQRWLLINQEFLKQLTSLASQLAKLPPSRTMIFISDGFDRVPGRELHGILDGFGATDRDFRFSADDTGPELEALLKVAEGSDIKFYTLDSRGLYTQAEMTVSGSDASRGGIAPPAMETQASVVAHEATDALSEMAHQTGGLFFENSNDLLKGIRRAFADGRTYYVISYLPINDKPDGKFRNQRRG